MQSLPGPVRKDTAKARPGFRGNGCGPNLNANTVKWNKRDMVCKNSEGLIIRRVKKGCAPDRSKWWISEATRRELENGTNWRSPLLNDKLEGVYRVRDEIGSLPCDVPMSLGKHKRWELVEPLHTVADYFFAFIVREVPLVSTAKLPHPREYLPKPGMPSKKRRRFSTTSEPSNVFLADLRPSLAPRPSQKVVFGRKGREIRLVPSRRPQLIVQSQSRSRTNNTRPILPDLVLVQQPLAEQRCRSYQRRSLEKNRRRITGKVLSKKAMMARSELDCRCLPVFKFGPGRL